jgi:hypothetical protein
MPFWFELWVFLDMEPIPKYFSDSLLAYSLPTKNRREKRCPKTRGAKKKLLVIMLARIHNILSYIWTFDKA